MYNEPLYIKEYIGLSFAAQWKICPLKTAGKIQLDNDPEYTVHISKTWLQYHASDS